jgi:hypothetical protein
LRSGGFELSDQFEKPFVHLEVHFKKLESGPEAFVQGNHSGHDGESVVVDGEADFYLGGAFDTEDGSGLDVAAAGAEVVDLSAEESARFADHDLGESVRTGLGLGSGVPRVGSAIWL